MSYTINGETLLPWTMSNRVTTPEHSDHLPVIMDERSLWVRRFLDADLAAVRIIARSARPRVGRALAVAFSKLGNGWIYLILGVVIFEWGGRTGFRVIILGGLNVALLHCLFPRIKRRVGRPRPFHVDTNLPSLLAVLDEHSFPSGHAMTLSGVVVPVVFVWPGAAVSAATLMLIMAWSRIATAHHYPSDILAGTLLGIVLAYPLSVCFFAVW